MITSRPIYFNHKAFTLCADESDKNILYISPKKGEYTDIPKDKKTKFFFDFIADIVENSTFDEKTIPELTLKVIKKLTREKQLRKENHVC